jgi:hypothetical protein
MVWVSLATTGTYRVLEMPVQFSPVSPESEGQMNQEEDEALVIRTLTAI